jgi:hypothetical protein
MKDALAIYAPANRAKLIIVAGSLISAIAVVDWASSPGFVGTGLIISELMRNRRIAMTHLAELEGQIKLPEDAEQKLRSLFESSSWSSSLCSLALFAQDKRERQPRRAALETDN